MNILILTNSNPYISAGIVAHYLYSGFKKNGHNTKVIVREYGNYKEKDIVCIEKKRDVIIAKIKNKVRKVLPKEFNNKKNVNTDNNYSIHDYDQTIEYYRTKDILTYVDFKPGIIIYLFPQWFLNAKNLYELNKITGAPIFWYLMDSAALTGGCHYFWDCARYLSGCGKCPGMYSNNEKDQSALNFNFKEFYLSKTNINIIAGTQRLFSQSKESLLYKDKPIHKILLPVDDEIFKPIFKNDLRKKLNLPIQKKIIFFGAGSLKPKRKGMKYLVESLKLIYNQQKDLNLLLLVAGDHFQYIKDEFPFEYRYLGLLENNKQLASAYQVSDVFVCPSIEDAGPLMVNQSIMCGTPVVSFEMGVASDLVINGKTGYIAELRNTEQLSKGIINILSLGDEELRIMSKNCRELGLKLLSQDVFTNEFEKIFLEK